jgi:DNA-binding response OmpR family regulator
MRRLCGPPTRWGANPGDPRAQIRLAWPIFSSTRRRLGSAPRDGRYRDGREMSPPQVNDLIRLSQRELDTMLLRAEREAPPPPERSKRRSRRLRMIGVRAILTIFEQDGSPTHFAVATRNISTHGLGLVHGRFVHPGARCVVSIRARHGEARALEGQIVKCRMMSGRLHDVGVQLDTSIDPTDFVEPSPDSAFNVEDVDPSMLKGRVLLVDQDTSMHGLFAHHLRETGLDARVAESAELAEQELTAEPAVMFVDVDLGGGQGLDFMRLAREKGFTGPIVAVTAEWSAEQRDQAIEAGAIELMGKPWTAGGLVRAIAECLLGTPAPPESAGVPIVSDAEHDDTPLELVEAFVEQLRTRADELSQAIESAEGETITHLLRAIKAGAAAHGFPSIAAKAGEAIAAVAAHEDLDGAAQPLRDVVAACYRARATNPEDESAQAASVKRAPAPGEAEPTPPEADQAPTDQNETDQADAKKTEPAEPPSARPEAGAAAA